MTMKSFLTPLLSLALAGACFAWCCETTHSHSFPQTCSSRVLTVWSPLNYNTCDGTPFSTVGCTAIPSTKVEKLFDYSGCPGSGCQGCSPVVTTIGSFPYTDYGDKAC